MRDARVGQEPLDVLLWDGHQVARHDGDGGQPRHERHPEQHGIAHALEVEAEHDDEARGLGRHGEPGHERGVRGFVRIGHPHVKGKGRDLEAQPAQREDHAQDQQRVAVLERADHAGQVRGQGDAVDEGQPVRDQGRGDRADEEELERGLHRLPFPLAEARQDVEGNGHELEGDEEQDQLARRGEDEHAEEGGEHGHVVLRGPTREGLGSEIEGSEHAQDRGHEEEALGEDGQLVLDEGAAEEHGAGLHAEGQAQQDHEPDGGDHADPTLVGPAQGEATEQHHQDDDGETDFEGHAGNQRDGRHGAPPRRRSSGRVAVSTGPMAMPGATPKRTRVPTRRTRATHSGPCASGRCWKCGSAALGPQKICLVTRRT